MSVELAYAHKPWALLGATGLTGRMVLDRAIAHGHRPLLVGRDRDRLAAIAAPLGLECRQVDLTDRASRHAAFAGCSLILNAAGPYAVTAPAAIAAAFEADADYIDLNGELAPLEQLLGSSRRARETGRVLVGGAGFGVAATDGLVRRVDRALAGAEWLRLSVATESAFATAGVADSTLDVLRGGGHEIEGGALVRRAIARRRWAKRDAAGKGLSFASAPLAELAAARAATGARRIVAGVPMSGVQALLVSTIAPLLPTLLAIPPIAKAMANTGGHGGVTDPDRVYRSQVWVDGGRGDERASAYLLGGEGFAMAADIALAAVEAMLERRPSAGAYTPATAFGAAFIDQIPGVEITQSGSGFATARDDVRAMAD